MSPFQFLVTASILLCIAGMIIELKMDILNDKENRWILVVQTILVALGIIVLASEGWIK